VTRIVFLSDLYFPFIGGAEEVCRMEAEGLYKRDYEVFAVTSLTPSSREREEVHGVKVLRVSLQDIRLKHEASSGLTWLAVGLMNNLLGNNLFSAQIVKRVIEKLKPDMVHVHNIGGEIPLLTLRALRQLKVPTVMTLHDYRLICPRATLYCHAKIPCRVPRASCNAFAKLWRMLLKNCVTQFISPSKFLADRLREKFGEVEVAVVPNPLQRIEAKPKKLSGPFQILYIGRLVWYKGVRVLLKAFRGLENRNVRLIIAGSGPELETVKRYSRADSRIIPLGFVSEEEKERLLMNANLVVIPSLWLEPFPMIVLESFGSGTPVVASRIGGIQELVEDGVNGRLFEPGESEELSEILVRLTEDKTEFKKLQNGAIESANKYHIDSHLNMLENIYSNVTSISN
jgi:glycosyltransferase involved in cell wall biosynthesis